MIAQQAQINHQQQHHQQQQQQSVNRLEESYHAQGNKLPTANGITKPITIIATTAATAATTMQQHSALPRHMLQMSQEQYVGEPTKHILSTQQQQQQQQLYYTQEQVKNTTNMTNCGNNNMPLNLSAKSKQSEPPTLLPTSTIAASTVIINTTTTTTSNLTTRKRSLEPQPESVTPSPLKPQTPNNSIIKNLLLNARGLAVPTGEGDDAVYKCPLCALEFRTAEDLQLHNATYCQGSSTSAPISPVASPSYKYFRSNSMSLNLPELKNSIFLKNNPLSLAKLAWSQLKTKPSSLVLSQLSAAQTTGNSNVNKSPKVVTANNSPTMTTSVTPTTTNKVINEAGPLPSPGPLLGKTPLVDAYNNNNISRIKSEDVVITKMHDDTQYTEELSNKRTKFDKDEHFSMGLLQVVSTKRSHSQSGGEVQVLQSKKEEKPKRFTNSGGCMIPISECADFDQSTKIIRTSLLSGGSFQEISPRTKDKREATKMKNGCATQFQFPPINSITAFNPLTLPALTTVSDEKIIPYVPGIPGPSSLTPQLPPPPQHLTPTARSLSSPKPRKLSPNRKLTSSPLVIATDVKTEISKSVSPFGGALNAPSEFSRVPPSVTARNVRNWSTSKNLEATPKKSFNFLRMADNLSPRKSENNQTKQLIQNQKEVRYFNFDVLNKEPDLIIRNQSSLTPLQINTNQTSSEEDMKKSKFLRPTSLPLKPGTFTPKRHHGITPTANTLPLISPETPRPSKACMQLYLNGHAYTYLGLKCSTKMYYCTVNLPQPSYVADMHKLSMYSVWQVCAENNPHPLGFKPKLVMSLYDSRQKSIVSTMAGASKLTYSLVISQPLVMTPFVNTTGQYYYHQQKQIPVVMARVESPEELKDGVESTANNTVKKDQQLLVGGYESHEDYTYIRGRGRGRYVCSECGIRCKKPSMLKKHIRTHTDVRPYTCTHCNFSFKTKGNLTKHMQSKTHYKKCIELGLNPGPMPPDSEFPDGELELDQQSTTSASGRTSSIPGESDSDDYSDNESENSGKHFTSTLTHSLNDICADVEDTKSRLQEHEAARCLLSLSMTPPITQSISPKPIATTATQSDSYQQQQQQQQTRLTALSLVTSTAKSTVTTMTTAAANVKRVVSFTSPKPPFDYQKQEQYYSNPEESKPKRSANANSTFESTPMDLTKPRSLETPSLSVTTENCKIMPGPIQTQAQIHDVIFGSSQNESGFLKTIYSVSDKVRVSSEPAEEDNINGNELLQAYLTEQALKYTRIKQSQMSRSFMDISTNYTSKTETLTTTTAGNSNMNKTKTSNALEEKSKVKENEDTNNIVPIIKVTEPKVNEAVCKSSDEGEESETSPSDTELALNKKTATQSSNNVNTSPHNSNLPAAVHQPGTTDFSGVLSPAAAPTRTVLVGEEGFKKTKSTDIPSIYARVPMSADGRSVCTICSKSFQKQHQLVLHMNIHYMERKFKCEPCCVSFRTQGHLQKHERSEAHKNKVMMTSTFGVPTTSNPRPFECTDCKIAFRIHGHLAKHLRSKTHVQKLECLQKLPFGTYAEIERAGISLTEIDTSDCDNSLISLKLLAQKLMEKDPSKLSSYTTPSGMNSLDAHNTHDSASEDGFSAAASAAANAIAMLDNDSETTTPQRGNSTSEDEGAGMIVNNLKRRLPQNSFSNGEEDSDTAGEQEKRSRLGSSNETDNNIASTVTVTN